ncbi:sulfurtransferase [Nocardioides gilvus]|uniref:sulfurtransferase n=1 Tax=Nocardioides gilvus TaxID=1735589 RepID=UPI000D74540C|nr:sulfurtransferase [Nocardioides gilvus]
MEAVLNVSAYLFTPIEDRDELRLTLVDRARAAELKGTILLAPEGINLFLAGRPEALRGFLADLRTDARFAALEPKESWSPRQPFGKMLVKLKNEIIRMDHPTIRPVEGRAPAVSPSTLRRWLDQGHDDDGRAVVMLDTRNAFEVGYGTFTGAIDWKIERFTQFPQAVVDHLDDLADKTVVSFCTGGIRCEKAAIYMREIGLGNVLQLEGGILNYFEEVGGDHFDGECFVFDEREALLPDLSTR